MPKNSITKLRESIKADRASPHNRLPDQALFALLDKRVEESISRRLDAGATLTGIHALPYSLSSGLNQIYFEFAPTGGVGLVPDAVLVILDSSSHVVGIVDPFDPSQPNRLLPPPPPGGLVPFVIARPSAQASVTFSAADLAQREAASRRFFRKLRAKNRLQMDLPIENEGEGGEGEGGEGEGGEGEGGEGEGTHSTTCVIDCPYSTPTSTAVGLTLEPTMLPFVHVDGSHTDYEPDGITDYASDQAVDDSG